ncbi:Bax inhibitor-1/YccA family protein [Nocardioides seonyuensis]|uniref:Bax inhibitor-1/YccA family protein n=1 Tax=Nocardioides seonyuensis TaxID=2518371 RepID=A0A4P7IC02_9ACTN|nr:Bax inhibitor-1/YccA family protein [Nocardioides seonyuensis]QBX54599.1 Bax inhibitor-1/YccA family protein [Nocardioides seonyuensis]
MQSNNPIFRRSEEFNRPSANAYGNQTYPGAGGGYAGYGQQTADPSTWGTGMPGEPGTVPGQVDQGRMTIDSVVQKSAMSLFVVIAAAAATWIMTPDMGEGNASGLYLALMIGSFGAFGLSMVNSFKKVISPALVIAFAALEGVALGAFSKVIPAAAGVSNDIVVQAVIGTFAAFAGTLAAYKFFNIQVGDRFRTFVVAAMFGMVALGLLEMVLGFFGNQIGFFGFGGIGLLFAVGGLVLGVFMLILDFDFVEKGIAAGLPERESWRAAFALTVSLVWIYTNLLRILAIFQQD